MPNPSFEEQERRSPEFSPGERLATLEATQGALDRRFDEVTALFDEKLSGLRRELEAINSALKDSVEKAEAAQQRQFSTYVEASDRKAEVTGQRISALERGEAGNSGVKDWWNRTAVVLGGLATFGVLIFYLTKVH